MAGGAPAQPKRDAEAFALRVPGRIEQRPRAMQLMMDALRACDLGADDEHRVVSAFGEAFNNVCVHGYRGAGGGEGEVEVEVEVEVTAGQLLVRLRDRGVAFDPEAVAAPNLEALPEGGVGVFIMRAAMDDVRWHREGGENVLTMTLHRSRTPTATER